MKNNTTNSNPFIEPIVKFIGQVFTILFESSDKREFKRLKNFIAS